MVNITHKNYSLRKAVASATVCLSSEATAEALQQGKVPKGNVFEFARAAALLAIKRTSEVIPDCHPLPIEFAAVTYTLEQWNIIITVEVHTIYKTGVEVEAMHGAAIAALTIYDMLKPIDKAVEIGTIKLLQKQGGKSDADKNAAGKLTAAVVVCSDSVSQGESQDTSGRLAVEKLHRLGLTSVDCEIVPDDIETIRTMAQSLADRGIDLLLFTGGTGTAPRDITPEAITPLIETPIPGIMEAFRHYGQQRMPHAMFSRGVAGFIKNSLVITLPGSPNAITEAFDALFPQLLHVFKVREGYRHV